MTIDRIRIQGYRSLYDVEFAPGPFSVLVGANNAGKSNLAASLDFLADAYRRGLKNAVEGRGGFDAITWRSADETAASIGFEIEASIPRWMVIRDRGEATPSNGGLTLQADGDEDAELVFRHAYSLAGRNEGVVSEFFVESEVIEVCAKRSRGCVPLMSGHRRLDPSTFAYSLDSDVSDADADLLLGLPGAVDARAIGQVGLPTAPAELAVSGLRFLSPIVSTFLGMVARTRVHNLVAAAGRAPGTPSADGDLLLGGLGLPTLVAFLEAKQPDAWDRVRQALFEIVPDLEDVEVLREYNNQLTLRFVEFGTAHRWTAFEVSDGTVRSLALLAALFDPRHQLVLVEEPENALHPWAIRVVVDACRAATMGLPGKQVILTTHSPVVVDQTRPEEVFVVWRGDGRTVVRPLTHLDREASALWESGRTDLSGLLDSGWLRESVPGGVG